MKINIFPKFLDVNFYDKTMEVSMYAFIFVLPFSKSMLEILFCIALVGWFIKRSLLFIRNKSKGGRLKARLIFFFKAFRPAKTDLDLPIFTFFLIGLLSTIKSVSVSLSLEGLFFKLFECIMIYYIVVEAINTEKKLISVIKVMLASMLFICVDSIFQLVMVTDFIRNYAMSSHRVQASFGNPNSLAAWLIIMIPVAFSLAYFKYNCRINFFDENSLLNKYLRPILWLLSGLLLICLMLTYTRGAWIAFVLSIFFIGIFRSRRLLIYLIIAIVLLPHILPDRVKERAITIARVAELDNSGLDTKRPHVWHEALKIIKDNPILGCGLNTYAYVAPCYKIFASGGYYPHNSYLHMAAESGLLGLGAFIWIFYILFRNSIRYIKRIDDNFFNAGSSGLLAGLFAFLIHSFFDVNIYTLQLGNLMWFFIGLIIAVRRIGLEQKIEK